MTEKNNDFSFEIRERIGVITKKTNGWQKELNIVCWNGREPAKFDIRDWSQDHTHMGRGITLYQDEMENLADIFQDYRKSMEEYPRESQVADVIPPDMLAEDVGREAEMPF